MNPITAMPDRIQISNLIGQYCVTEADGQKLYSALLELLAADRPIVVDFSGVGVFSTSFFAHSIGRIAQKFPPDRLNEDLQILNLASWGQETLQAVLSVVKRDRAH